MYLFHSKENVSKLSLFTLPLTLLQILFHSISQQKKKSPKINFYTYRNPTNEIFRNPAVVITCDYLTIYFQLLQNSIVYSLIPSKKKKKEIQLSHLNNSKNPPRSYTIAAGNIPPLSRNTPTNPSSDVHPVTLVPKNQRQHLVVYLLRKLQVSENIRKRVSSAFKQTGGDRERERERERERTRLHRQVLLVRNAWSFCRAAQSKAAPGVLQFRPLSTPLCRPASKVPLSIPLFS